MYLITLIVAFVYLFYISPYDRCNEPYTINNLQVKTCYYRTAFTTKYSTEYFDLISGEMGKSGKHDSLLTAINKGMNDLYSKNTIGRNCVYKPELYEGYKVRYCYFYPDGEQKWKVIVGKQGLLTEGVYVTGTVDNKSIEMAIKDYKEKEGKSLCF